MRTNMLAEHADRLYEVAGIFLIAGAIVTALSTWVITSAGKERDRQKENSIVRLKLETAQANERTAELTKEAGQLRLDLEKEKERTAARSITADQARILGSVGGKVPVVSIAWQKDLEAMSFASQLADVLRGAGVKVQIFEAHGEGRWTGILISFKDQRDPTSDPLLQSLVKANLYGASGDFFDLAPGAPRDVPLLLVGQPYLHYQTPPYSWKLGNEHKQGDGKASDTK
jgi:hypothetical protein